MRLHQGAWINAADGRFAYVDEHANWAKRPGNLAGIGIAIGTWEAIHEIPNDYDGESRKTILLIVMAAGGVRMRGHHDFVTFEFTCDPKVALPACRGVLTQIAGPLTRCRFNSLSTNETVEVSYDNYVKQMENSTSLHRERP